MPIYLNNYTIKLRFILYQDMFIFKKTEHRIVFLITYFSDRKKDREVIILEYWNRIWDNYSKA